MSDIFISYSKPGKPLAETLAKVLGKRWTVWWDPKIPPGRRFGAVIQQELEAARCVIVLWSKHSVKSHYVCEEAEFARLNDKLVPALVEEAELPIGFRTIEAARLMGWQGDETDEEFVNLLAELRRRLAPATPTPLAAQGLHPLFAEALGALQPLARSPAQPTLSPAKGLGLANHWRKPITDRPGWPGARWAGLLDPRKAAAPTPAGVLFEDHFQDNRNNWPERRDHQKIILRVVRGHYEIESKVVGQTWCTWRPIQIDPARDFEIEADITTFGFSASDTTRSEAWPMFGVLWGGKDVHNFYVSLVGADQRMSVKRTVANEWSDVIPWRLCTSMQAQSRDFTIGIRKKAKVIEFRVNDQWFEDADFEPLFGSNVGFYVCNEADIWVKRLKVAQL